ncbi:hypothetical protein [Streptomyces antimicrobicus]|uniref:Uncharacterized protein n=1 Tax=Streptomyces antimicrobicus TaxID=2883108 RepID=A0ABS8B5Y6_9ACTN|nr:hypothetical protein [Streptomyces antimicrobicus]MCB5180019.1 hypothetical protein [Streptomyces antimicrobicus]
MPTPYGSRGGMAFSAAELHVLRRSLAHALQSSTAPLPATDVQDCLRLAQAVDEAVREAGRLRAFLAEDLGRYRRALPGSLHGYLELLQDALRAGYRPCSEDLAALRALRGNAAAAGLLDHCARLALDTRPAVAAVPRARLTALAGGKDLRARETGRKGPGKEGEEAAPEQPAKPAPREPAPRPERPIPTPGEVFPPRRKPTPPPAARRAAG